MIEDSTKVYKNMVKARTEDCINYQKEIERLNNIINEIEAIIYNTNITGIEARLEIQERLDKLKELKGGK